MKKVLSIFILFLILNSCKEEEDEPMACEISNLTVEIGDCTSENTYNLTVDFDYQNPGNDYFNLYVRNNELIGTYPLSDLPLHLENFELSGLDNDYIKVAINDNNDCFQVKEFLPPNCENNNPCEISNLTVEIGDCTSENTYNLTVDFDYQNPGNDYFNLYVRNNELIGTYPLSDLPLNLENFEMSGLDNDYIKVAINDNNDCFQVKEFLPPNCF